MRNLLAFLAAAAITIALVGWYLDWFQVRSTTNAESGQPKVEIDINSKKIGQDLHRGGQALENAIEKKKPDDAKGDAKSILEGVRDEAGRAATGVKNDVEKRFDNVRD
jgi:hypothetical protein